MKLEIGSGGGGVGVLTSATHQISKNISSSSYSRSREGAKPRGASPVIKNGFSGSIFQRKIAKKAEMDQSEGSRNGLKKTTDNDIASDYFKSTYGANEEVKDLKENPSVVANGSEGVTRRRRSVSKSTNTPDREKSIEPQSCKDSPSRYSSFSYLNLLPPDGSFPHRTQPIGDSITKSRRNSEVGDSGPLKEFTNVTNNSNFMVRSNPIGLAEPSNKKDGYAVGKDGSLYRSSENLYISSTRDSSKERSSSISLRENGSGNWKERRSSWSTTVSTGIGLGRGLIETGKPAKSIFMPFGSTKGVIKSYLQKHMNKNKSEQSSNTSLNTTSMTINKKKPDSIERKKEESLDIQKGIEEIRSLTKSHSCSSSSYTIKMTSSSNFNSSSERKSRKSEFEDKKQQQSHSSTKVGMAFKELDVSLKAIPSKDDVQTVTLPTNKRRTLSLNRKSINELPEDNVTISLPGSRRTSRNPSIERKPLRKDSSVEIFRGSYDIKVGVERNSSKVKEISSDVVLMKGNCQENESAHAVLHLDQKACKKVANLDSGSKNQKIISMKSIKDETKIFKKDESTKIEKDEFKKSESTETEIESSSNISHNSESNVTRSIHQSMESENTINMESHRSETCSQTLTTTISSTLQQSSTTTENETKHTLTNNCEGVGHALKGLDVALEALAKERNAAVHSDFKALKGRKMSAGAKSCSNNNNSSKGGSVLNITVSLPASRRGSRCPSTDRNGTASRSRRNSMDLYSAEYKMKLSKDGKSTLEQKSVCHIKVDEKNKDDLNLCGRCHNMNHFTARCTEFGNLKCPRCLEWDHWEDTCPTALISTDCSICDKCGANGHVGIIHSATDFNQRRCIVDMLGWVSFQEWFYEFNFRSWWQLNGYVGVPLYKIYKRNTEWRLEPKVETDKKPPSSSFRSEHSTRAKGGYVLSRDDSIDELMKCVYTPRKRVNISTHENDSGRSTPEYLKKYPGSTKTPDDASDSESSIKPTRRRRTFSETLSMLDDDILAELDIK
ncbi:uncharacterized protein [Lepeophtheirus salmonis]|uniref:uncharacterized protein n=1 Tax=Lepeophtheirus salmonis TaxID=72036 RepID=UPI001AE3CFE4|nr:serine-rich adhesin for platelets-like [Lepeophtheirus salmonis]